MNFECLNFARISGLSPSSSTRDGTMLQISILAWSARDCISPKLGRTPDGPKMQCRLKSEGMRISMMIPAPFAEVSVALMVTKQKQWRDTHMTHGE